MSEFSVELDVRWGDVDSFEHVNNAVFLSYLEQCRTEWMNSVPSHWQQGESGPVVANININYRRPIHWPARLKVTLVPDSPGRSSMKLNSQIRSIPADPKQQPVLFADAVVTIVWIDKKSGESVPLPNSIRELGACRI
ncbi:MAG: acyl-CoA thioesterase [Xanthomonadaceae bacterium]|nr:acyl-CoA thioesterase [Xanthomonadaceae bacterium]